MGDYSTATATFTGSGLNDREIARLNDAARTLTVSKRKLLELMAGAGVPVIDLGPRRRGILVAHLDQLIAGLARPALKTENAA